MGGADLSWVAAALSSPDPSVRSAAWRALGAYGWNRRLRDAVDLDAIATDPVPAVRASAYRALGVWGDADALAAIEAAGSADPDARAQVAAAETLVGQRGPDAASAREWTAASVREGAGSSDGEAGASFDTAWAWATEHARFDRLARDISRDRERLREEVRG